MNTVEHRRGVCGLSQSSAYPPSQGGAVTWKNDEDEDDVLGTKKYDQGIMIGGVSLTRVEAARGGSEAPTHCRLQSV